MAAGALPRPHGNLQALPRPLAVLGRKTGRKEGVRYGVGRSGDRRLGGQREAG